MMDEIKSDWNGNPLDEPGRDARERLAYDLHDAHETAKALNVFVMGALAWEGRLTVRQMRPAYVAPPQSQEDQEASRLADVRGLVNLREQSGMSVEEWANQFT